MNTQRFIQLACQHTRSLLLRHRSRLSFVYLFFIVSCSGYDEVKLSIESPNLVK